MTEYTDYYVDPFNEDEAEAELIEAICSNIMAKTPERSEAERAEAYAELDRTYDAWDERHKLWEDALKRWRLPMDILSGDTEYDDADHPHPLSKAYWAEETPEEAAEVLNGGKPLTRADAEAIHRRWKREGQQRKELIRKKRAANRMQHTSQSVEQALEAVDAYDELYSDDDPFGVAELINKAKAAKKAADPYIDGASMVAQRWRNDGAKLPGVRFDDKGKLPAGSKLVRWFKAYCGDKTPKRVAETAQRMAGPKRRWRNDLEAYRAWKG